MKDKDLFLNTNFDTADLAVIKKRLIASGWFIHSEELNNIKTVTIYESEDDYRYKEVTASGDSLEICLAKIQDYYNRVLITEK